MKDLFLFAGLISQNHAWIYLFHVILVAIIAIGLARLATSSMQLVPRGFQNIFEAYLGGVMSMGRDTLGSDELARKYLPLVATIGLMVCVANLIGMVPGFEAPTAFLDFTLSLALIVFIYYNFEGIRENGVVKYFAHFMGPVKALAPIMFPVEVLSHISRVISLSFRLFGNIKGDDLFLAVL
ncbi:MAG: F0F1 ATP synthase subunit A, partial [Campylobacterales bacterium]|nr:F0F1 ATP synthase subunit A [Campylobacterales bacterium]